MSINKVLSGGYNSKNLYNIYLPGIPTVSTPLNNLEKLQIVNIEYVNNKVSIINSKLSTINTAVNNLETKMSLANNYTHVSDPIYYISTYTNIIIDAESIIYLPETPNDGHNVNIANNSGTSVTINTQNGQLIYSSFYINPAGSTSFVLEKFKMAKLININKNNLFSWVLLLS